MQYMQCMHIQACMRIHVIHSHTYISELVSHENIRPDIAYFSHIHDDFKEFEPLKISTFKSKSNLYRYYERLRIFKKYEKVKSVLIIDYYLV